MESASYNTYLVKIDKFQNRAFRIGFQKEILPVTKLFATSDRKVWGRVISSNNGPCIGVPFATYRSYMIAAELRPSLWRSPRT